MQEIGILENPFYCKKRDKVIKSSFEIDSEFCNDCELINDDDLTQSECEVVQNATFRFMDDEGNIVDEDTFKD
jgi:hypothetical protein